MLQIRDINAELLPEVKTKNIYPEYSRIVCLDILMEYVPEEIVSSIIDRSNVSEFRDEFILFTAYHLLPFVNRRTVNFLGLLYTIIFNLLENLYYISLFDHRI